MREKVGKTSPGYHQATLTCTFKTAAAKRAEKVSQDRKKLPQRKNQAGKCKRSDNYYSQDSTTLIMMMDLML